MWWVFAPSLCACEQSSAHFQNHENQFHKSWLLISTFLHSNRSIKIEPRHLLLLLLGESLKGTIHFPCLGKHCYRMYLMPKNRGRPKKQKSDLNRLQRAILFPPLRFSGLSQLSFSVNPDFSNPLFFINLPLVWTKNWRILGHSWVFTLCKNERELHNHMYFYFAGFFSILTIRWRCLFLFQ